MDNGQIETSGIKSSQAQVYEKTSNILRAIEQCGCEHCLKILRSGFGNQPNTNTDDTTNPVTSRIDHV